MTSSSAPPASWPRAVLVQAVFELDRRLGEPLIVALLNRALAVHIRDGGLDGMAGRVVCVALRDTPWSLCLGLEDGRLTRAPGRTPETVLSVFPADAVRLFCRREDPDTLFFQRRLTIDGDVELGLYIKNALDALDETTLPGWATALLRAAAARLPDSH